VTGDKIYQVDIVDFTAWDIALTDDEIAELGKGAFPLSVRPEHIFEYHAGETSFGNR